MLTRDVLSTAILEQPGKYAYMILDQNTMDSMKACLLYTSRYDAKPIGHFGLALNDYTHFTSPIRRYPDLIVHRMLRKYYINGLTDAGIMEKDEKWVEKAAIQCSDTEVNAVMAERDVDDMKKAEYMEKHIGEEYPGIISSVTKFGIFVELANTIEGLVHVSNLEDHYDYDEDSRSLIGRGSGTVLKMGMPVMVKAVSYTHLLISSKGANGATSLSIFELNYLLNKTPVKTVMIKLKDLITIHEDNLLEEAALLMLKYDCLLYTSRCV